MEVSDYYNMPLLELVRHEGRRSLEQFLHWGQAGWQECFIEVDMVRGGRVAVALLPCCYEQDVNRKYGWRSLFL